MRWILILCLLGTSCAHAFRVPCLDQVLPRPVKMLELADPEPFTYVDEDGHKQSGMRLEIDTDSAVKFFQYVQALEAASSRAVTCYRNIDK